MIISVIEAAVRRSLTTPGRYRDAMPEADLPDEELERVIARCTGQIERYCDRIFARQRIIEETTGAGLQLLALSVTPVLAVHGVTVDGTATVAGSFALLSPNTGLLRLTAVETHEYMWRALGGPRLYDRAVPAPQRYGVDYTGGYVMPDDYGEAETVPPDLEHACQLVVRGTLEARGRPTGIKSERLGDASWTYGDEQPGWVEAKPILDFYRRLVV